MENQIICFVDPSKFCHLLGSKKAEDINYDADNNDVLRYVDILGNTQEVGQVVPNIDIPFNILLVPDTFKFNYEPKIHFKVLYHTHTPREKITHFRGLLNYEGEEETPESIGTLYQEIAQFVGNPEACQEKYDLIYSRIKKNHRKIEIALDFLHLCLNGKPLELPTNLSNEETTALFNELPNETTHKDYNANLMALRDALLKEA